MIQRDILTLTAERSEDTMEHCRLMLLLFKKFPQNTSQLIVSNFYLRSLHFSSSFPVSHYGILFQIRLVDTLMTAEKHGHCTSVINCYRKTLGMNSYYITSITTFVYYKELSRRARKSYLQFFPHFSLHFSTIESF